MDTSEILAFASLVMDKITESPKGGSVNTVFPDYTPTEGYMVGGKSWSMVVSKNQVDTVNILSYVLAHTSLMFKGAADVYLGWWEHQGKVHIDISDHLGTLKSALEVARERGKLAVWDIAGNMEVGVL